ncbi:unnamed protein product [Ixodes hexagonus]
MSLLAFIVVAAVAWNFAAVDATFDFGSPFQWLGGGPAVRSATGNLTLNDTATTVAATSVVDLLATAPPFNYMPTVNLDGFPLVYVSNYSSNYSTVSLDDLPLAIGHLQDPVLKLVTEPDGTAGFVVFDGRHADNASNSPSTTVVSTITATSETAPTPTTAVSPTTASPPLSMQVTVAPPAASFPGLLSFLRPYIFGPRAPPVPSTETFQIGSTLPPTTPVSFKESETVSPVASTTIAVEPRSMPVSILPLKTTPALSTASTTAGTDAYTTLSTGANGPPLSETSATTVASTGADPLTRSGMVNTETSTSAPAATTISTTTESMAEDVSTGSTTVLYKGEDETTLVPKLSSTVSTTAVTTTTAFPEVTTDFGTTTGSIFNTRSGGVTVTLAVVTRPTSTQQTTSPIPTAPHHRVIKITEPSTDAANFTQPPLLQGLLSGLDGVQEDGTMSPAAEDAPQYRHFYDPSQIMHSAS